MEIAESYLSEIEFDGKKYLTDFLWINVSNTQKKIWESEAKSRAAKHGRGLCLLRIGRVQKQPYQYGLRESMPKVKLNKIPRSLALSVVNGFPTRNYLGFFAIAGGWWVVTMWNGQLMLSGDRFFTVKEEATEFFFSVKGMHQWENNEVVNLSEDPKESETRLKDFIENEDYANRTGYIDFNAKQPTNYVALGVVLVAALGWAIWTYKDDLFPKQIIPPQSPQVLFPSVWQEKPPAWDVFEACEEAMNSVPLTENLWTAKEAVCSGNTLKITYKRNENGSYLYLPKGAVMHKDNNQLATKTIPLKKLKHRKAEKIVPLRQTYLDLLEFFRIMGMYTARASLNITAPATTSDGDPPVEVTAPFATLNFKIYTNNFPREIFQKVAKVPGTVLKSMHIQVHEDKFVWNFVGTVYGVPSASE